MCFLFVYSIFGSIPVPPPPRGPTCLELYMYVPSCLRNALNLNNGAVAGGQGLETGTRGHGLGQEGNVGLVHGGKVLHVGQVDIVLDHLVQAGAGQLQDLLEILQYRSLVYVWIPSVRLSVISFVVYFLFFFFPFRQSNVQAGLIGQ